MKSQAPYFASQFRDFESKLKLECIKFRDFLRIFDVKVALTPELRDNYKEPTDGKFDDCTIEMS